MPKFPFIRAFANLRRIARELTRGNDLAEARMNLEHPEWKRRGKPARLVHTGVASVESWNKRYAELHPEPPEPE